MNTKIPEVVTLPAQNNPVMSVFDSRQAIEDRLHRSSAVPTAHMRAPLTEREANEGKGPENVRT